MRNKKILRIVVILLGILIVVPQLLPLTTNGIPDPEGYGMPPDATVLQLPSPLRNVVLLAVPVAEISATTTCLNKGTPEEPLGEA